VKHSGYGTHVGHVFVRCILYADYTVLLCASCYGLQKLVNISKLYWNKLDIKFNSLKSQLITFGGHNPRHSMMKFIRHLMILRHRG